MSLRILQLSWSLHFLCLQRYGVFVTAKLCSIDKLCTVSYIDKSTHTYIATCNETLVSLAVSVNSLLVH